MHIILGATGRVGSALVEKLINKCEAVRAVIRNASKADSFLISWPCSYSSLEIAGIFGEVLNKESINFSIIHSKAYSIYLISTKE